MELQNLAVEFFSRLYEEEGGTGYFPTRNTFTRITVDSNASLMNAISEEEIHKAIQSMKGFKAPGPDGI